MSTTNEESETRLGVRDAMDLWLSQHPKTLDEILVEATGKAVRDWLDEHTDVLIEMAATKLAALMDARDDAAG